MHKHITASITQRGQVTIPAEVMRLIGVKPRGKVVFEVEDGCVKIARPAFTLEEAFGSVTPINRPEDFEEISRIAKEEVVERYIAKMRRE